MFKLLNDILQHIDKEQMCENDSSPEQRKASFDNDDPDWSRRIPREIAARVLQMTVEENYSTRSVFHRMHTLDIRSTGNDQQKILVKKSAQK